MKVYTLTIVFDEDAEEIEYIEEEMTEDSATAGYKLQMDPEYYDNETLMRLIRKGLIAES